jgi:TetR/AcrR family transcriptional regulator, repressor of fatR-cypB operon
MESRKDREKIFRKNEILEAAVQLFAVKGYNATTLDEIAAAAQFGKGTLYNYFNSKEEIYIAIIKNVANNHLSSIRDADASADSIKDFFHKYTTNLINYLIKNRYSFLLFVRELSQLDTDRIDSGKKIIAEEYGEVRRIFIKWIENGIRSNDLRDIEPDKIATLFDHMVFPYVHHLLICSGMEDINIEKEIEFLLSVFFKGVLNAQ